MSSARPKVLVSHRLIAKRLFRLPAAVRSSVASTAAAAATPRSEALATAGTCCGPEHLTAPVGNWSRCCRWASRRRRKQRRLERKLALRLRDFKIEPQHFFSGTGRRISPRCTVYRRPRGASLAIASEHSCQGRPSSSACPASRRTAHSPQVRIDPEALHRFGSRTLQIVGSA